MKQLKAFEHEKFSKLEVLTMDGNEFFPAIEVAEKLGYSNPSDAISRHSRKNGVVFHEVIDSMGRKQLKKFIDEGNLYRLIARSKLPEAEKFEVWVFDTILPSIRKTGGYVANDDLFIQTYLPQADEQTKILFKTTLEALKAQNEQMVALKPKVLFAEAVETSESSILVGELSKLIQQNGVKMGQNRLFEWLRENGFLLKKNGDSYNLPTQKSMDLGLFEIKKRIIQNPKGAERTVSTPKVTGKGQIYFVNRFLNE